jgi:hypothetical protein
MIVIKVSPATKQQIVAYRDLEQLRQVIEAEEKKAQQVVNENTDYSNYRFYQGVLQAFKAVNHLLHP